MGKTLQFQNIGDRGNWVDDEWVPAQEGKTISIVSPYFDKEIATVPDSSKADLDAVVNRAKEAFPGWAATNIKDRSKVCLLYTSPSPRDS